jgi:hypothetical protein
MSQSLSLAVEPLDQDTPPGRDALKSTAKAQGVLGKPLFDGQGFKRRGRHIRMHIETP